MVPFEYKAQKEVEHVMILYWVLGTVPFRMSTTGESAKWLVRSSFATDLPTYKNGRTNTEINRIKAVASIKRLYPDTQSRKALLPTLDNHVSALEDFVVRSIWIVLLSDLLTQ